MLSWVETNYSSCKVSFSKNICSSSGDSSGKRKDRMKPSLSLKLMVFWGFFPHWMLMYFFGSFFFLNLTLCMTKLRILMLCFSYFTGNSLFSLMWKFSWIGTIKCAYKFGYLFAVFWEVGVLKLCFSQIDHQKVLFQTVFLTSWPILKLYNNIF
jgi:hypothetical protein